MTPTQRFEFVQLTPNGREIRRNLATGQYEVQPRNDNYWIACDTLGEAHRAYDPEWDGCAPISER